MTLFSIIQSGLGASPSLLMIIMLGVADQLWGDAIFNCPCGDRASRILFTVPFLAVPPLVVIAVDTPWRFVRTSFKCDRDLKCCRWLSRPLIIAFIWFFFSLLQPKFEDCMFLEEPCECEGCDEATVTGKKRAAYTRVVVACIALAVGACLFLFGCFFFLWMCSKNQCRPCCSRVDLCGSFCRRCCSPLAAVFPDENKLGLHRCLTDTVLAMGLQVKTITTLESKGLLKSGKQLAEEMTEDKIKDLDIAPGQKEILRRFPGERVLVQTLLILGLSVGSIVKLREREFLGVIEARCNEDGDPTQAEMKELRRIISREQSKKLMKSYNGKFQGRATPKFIQTLLKAGLEAHTLLMLKADQLLNEQTLPQLMEKNTRFSRKLRNVAKAISRDQYEMLMTFSGHLESVKTLLQADLNSNTLAKLAEKNLLDAVADKSRGRTRLSDEQLLNLEKDLSPEQFDKLLKFTDQYADFFRLCKAKVKKLEAVLLTAAAKDAEPSLELVDETSEMAQLDVSEVTRKRLEEFLSPSPITVDVETARNLNTRNDDPRSESPENTSSTADDSGNTSPTTDPSRSDGPSPGQESPPEATEPGIEVRRNTGALSACAFALPESTDSGEDIEMTERHKLLSGKSDG